MAVPLYDSTTQYDATLVGYDGLGDGVTTMPTLGVFIAFDGSPYDVEPVWTEVTPYVTNVNIDRGRSDDFSPFVSTAYVTFQNNTRLFDPFNTAGTYYGKLLPRKQIKIVAMNNGVLYPVFRGFVEGFPVQFTEAGYASTVSVQCFDLLALLAQSQMPDALDLYTKSLSPQFYFPLNDPQGSTVLTDSINGNNATLAVGDAFISRPALNNYVSGTSVFLPSRSGWRTPEVPLSSNINASIAYWFIPYGVVSSGIAFVADEVSFTVTASETVSIDNFRLTVTFAHKPISPSTIDRTEVYTPSYSIKVGEPHHIAITWNGNTNTPQIFINGVSQTLTINTYTLFTPNYNYTNLFIGGGNTTQYGAQYQQISAYTRVLTSTEITNLFSNAASVYIENTAARFNRLISYTQVSSSRTNATSTPVATVSEMSKQSTPIVDALNTTVNAEYGFMFCDKDGKIQFKDRNYVYSNTTSNTSQATIGTGGIPFEPQIDMQLSGDQIRNDVTVTFSGEGTVTRQNATSVAAFGTNGETVDTQLSTIAQAKTLASYVGTVAGNLTTNLSPLRIGVTKTTADYATMLGLELLDRTTVVVTPKTGSSFTKVQLLNKITHNITPSSWDITVDGSEQYTAWFILNSSTLNGANLLQ